MTQSFFVNGYSVNVRTELDRGNRLTAKVIVPDLDSMVIAQVCAPKVYGDPASCLQLGSLVKKAINMAATEFRKMAAMATGKEAI